MSDRSAESRDGSDASAPGGDALRLLEFVKYNEPAGPVGCSIVIGAWWYTGANWLGWLLLAVALNWVFVLRAKKLLQRNDVETAVLFIALGMWPIALALWVLLPVAHSLAAVIGIMPIILAAAYLQRRFLFLIMAISVVIALIGGLLVPFQPLFEEEQLDVALWIVVGFFAPALTASCALAIWHSVRRVVELLDETQQANVALEESERLLEVRVEERTAELRESEQNLAEARDDALAASRTKSTFLANMSHELRTPLNAIIGYSEMLQEEATEDGNDEYVPDLERVLSSGRHLLGLINDVLDLSKIEAGKVDLFAETFEVGPFFDDLARTVEPLIVRNDNELAIDVADDVVSLHTDVTRLRQILLNLLSNASKFTNEGTIRVVVRSTELDGGEGVDIRVVDTGIGMTEEQLERIFDAFGQAERSTTRDYGGTGLGLAITKRFCELLGGSIDVSSEPDVGSEFIVRVPSVLHRTPEEMVPSPSPVTAGMTADRKTILVIDDEESARTLIARSLDAYRVVTASSGEEGIRLANEERPDVITLDVMMPRMDGWTVLSRLKDDPATSDIPVILITMSDDDDLGYALGAAEFLTKPIERQRLLDLLTRLVPGQEERILIVDDDAQTRDLLRSSIEKAGFMAEEATNGREAVERLDEVEPALILLDLMMPEMNGFEFLAELRGHPRWANVPVIVITSKDLSAEERSVLTGDVQRVLMKGAYSRESLFDEVRRVLETRSSIAADAT